MKHVVPLTAYVDGEKLVIGQATWDTDTNIIESILNREVVDKVRNLIVGKGEYSIGIGEL